MLVYAPKKTPNELAEYAGTFHRNRMMANLRSTSTPLQSAEEFDFSGAGYKAQTAYTVRKELDAIVVGVTVSGSDYFDVIRRKSFDEAEFQPDASGGFWKVIYAYCEFIHSAFPATRIRGSLVSTISKFVASHGSQASQPSKQQEKPLPGELLEYRDQEALCWIEIADGMRVCANLPASSLKAAMLNEGDEFLWYPISLQAVKAEETEDSEERRRLIADVEALTKRFHEELKHVDTGLEAK